MGQYGLGCAGPLGAGGAPHWHGAQNFASLLTSIPDARHFVEAVLAGRGVDPWLVELAALATSELATNAVVHGCTPFDVVVDVTDSVRIAVTDGSPARPVLRDVEPMAEHGRGLALVDATADRWGINRAGAGKQVWWEHGRWLARPK